jgi:hypothetical protein
VQERSPRVPEPGYKVIFKNGDDLRQDQLVIQVCVYVRV